MVIETIPAKHISYGNRRDVLSVKAIVIHNTGNSGDTAIANAKYFNSTNTRSAGAHYFIDQKGKIVCSIGMSRTAYSVGGNKYSDCNTTGGGKFYGIYTNENTVSIELCDIIVKGPSKAMIKAVKRLIKHIRKTCPNAKRIIRHFDVNGKHCPVFMMDEAVWNKFLHDIGENGQVSEEVKNHESFTVKIACNTLNIRAGAGTEFAILGSVNKGEVYTIVDTKNSWGKLKSGAGWINISDKYVKKA